MTTHIYCRVSTSDQTTEGQIYHLRKKYPDANVVQETGSGIKTRPELDKLVAKLQRGDTLVVAALDRLGRRTFELIAFLEDFEKRGIIFISEREGLDYSTMVGKLVFTILAGVAQMERTIISERTKKSLAAARAKPGYKGPMRQLTDLHLDEMAYRLSQGETKKSVGKSFGVCISHVYRLMQDRDARLAKSA